MKKFRIAIKDADTVYEQSIRSNKALANAAQSASSIKFDDAIIRKAFETYCEQTGYAKPEEYESNKAMTLAGLQDVAAAYKLGGDVLKNQHDLWSWHRLNEGWHYGDKKDKAAKTNPCLKEFEKLTPQEISWDKMFKDIYDSVMKTNAQVEDTKVLDENEDRIFLEKLKNDVKTALNGHRLFLKYFEVKHSDKRDEDYLSMNCKDDYGNTYRLDCELDEKAISAAIKAIIARREDNEENGTKNKDVPIYLNEIHSYMNDAAFNLPEYIKYRLSQIAEHPEDVKHDNGIWTIEKNGNVIVEVILNDSCVTYSWPGLDIDETKEINTKEDAEEFFDYVYDLVGTAKGRIN